MKNPCNSTAVRRADEETSQRLGYTIHLPVVHKYMKNSTVLMMGESYSKAKWDPISDPLHGCPPPKKKKQKRMSVGRDRRRVEPLYTALMEYKTVQLLWNTWEFLGNKIYKQHVPTVLLPGVHRKTWRQGWRSLSHNGIHTRQVSDSRRMNELYHKPVVWSHTGKPCAGKTEDRGWCVPSQPELQWNSCFRNQHTHQKNDYLVLERQKVLNTWNGCTTVNRLERDCGLDDWIWCCMNTSGKKEDCLYGCDSQFRSLRWVPLSPDPRAASNLETLFQLRNAKRNRCA